MEHSTVLEQSRAELTVLLLLLLLHGGCFSKRRAMSSPAGDAQLAEGPLQLLQCACSSQQRLYHTSQRPTPLQANAATETTAGTRFHLKTNKLSPSLAAHHTSLPPTETAREATPHLHNPHPEYASQSAPPARSMPFCLSFLTPAYLMAHLGLLAMYLFIAFKPSAIACLDRSPGSSRRQANMISRPVSTDFLLY